MTKEEKRKQKEYEKKVKAINKSLSYLSKEKQSELGVVSVQQEENVFFCGDGCYKKVYMFHPASLGNKRTAFIKALTDRYDNRIRFSICTRNYKDKLSAYMFMTVTFQSETYYEVRKKIRSFEESLISEICSFLGISIKPCSIENVLTYSWMNFSGEMKKISPDILFGRTEKIFKEMTECASGHFEAVGRYGRTFVGKNYPDTTNGINEFMHQHEGAYYVVVDFQRFNDEEQHLYDFEIKNRYSLHNEVLKPNFINMSYFLTVLRNNSDSVKRLCNDAYQFYDNHGIQLMPGIGREKEIFLSSCSLGLVDFHSMQNASENIIGGLLL